MGSGVAGSQEGDWFCSVVGGKNVFLSRPRLRFPDTSGMAADSKEAVVFLLVGVVEHTASDTFIDALASRRAQQDLGHRVWPLFNISIPLA
jgi:hypothetical protein